MLFDLTVMPWPMANGHYAWTYSITAVRISFKSWEAEDDHNKNVDVDDEKDSFLIKPETVATSPKRQC